MLKLGKCLDGEDESDKVIPWTALASSQSKTHNLFIFSIEKIPKILNLKMVQGGDLIS